LGGLEAALDAMLLLDESGALIDHTRSAQEAFDQEVCGGAAPGLAVRVQTSARSSTRQSVL
jgi:hypothetical protein